MTELRRRAALERRYDGPIPPLAGLSPDAEGDLKTRLVNRRRWSWRHVRAVGHELVGAGRAFRARGDIAEFRRWAGLRRDLAHALRSWAAFRDWHAAVAAARDRCDAA